MGNIHTDKPQLFKDMPELQEREPYFLMVKELSKPDFFKQLARLFLDLADKGTITRQKAAHKVAAWISDPELKSIPAIYAIMMLARELELPDTFAMAEGDKSSYDEMWLVLRNMLEHVLVDAVLFCRHCDKPFLFTTEEQEVFASQGRTHIPYRCPACRDLHKTQVDHTTFICEVC